MNELLNQFGSFRRLTEAYWFGQLTPQQERTLEDGTPKETLSSYKPVDSQNFTQPSAYERARKVALRAAY